MAVRRRHAGFTLVELVVVLVLTATLAVFALPRMVDVPSWRLQAYADDLRSQSMALQRLALVQRRPVVATFTPAGASFAYEGGDTLATLPCPAALSPCIAESGSRSATFNASQSGRTRTPGGIALPITLAAADLTLTYQIEPETGLFRTVP